LYHKRQAQTKLLSVSEPSQRGVGKRGSDSKANANANAEKKVNLHNIHKQSKHLLVTAHSAISQTQLIWFWVGWRHPIKGIFTSWLYTLFI
jgi:hypothetical protein